MFAGFTDETVQFLLELKFHNEASFFHAQHDRYIEVVRTPFYELIEALGPTMLEIDSCMEVRPGKCLSRIHRDTRFSRDKSPYRDHHWLLFRRAAEPREQALFYYFEFGPDRLSWGMGIWGENRALMDMFRRRIQANPAGIAALIDDLDLESHHLYPGGTFFKRMEIPPDIPPRLKPWYTARELYIGKHPEKIQIAYSERLLPQLKRDFKRLAPFYRLLRGLQDDLLRDTENSLHDEAPGR